VTALKPKEQFRSLLIMTAERTQTVRMAEVRDGLASRKKLVEAVDGAVDRHAAEWEQNLVASWERLGPAEIRQVCDALKGRDEKTFMQFAQRVGSEAKSRNDPLLKRAGVEVLDQVW